MSDPTKIANIIQSYSYMKAGQMEATIGSTGHALAQKQIASGNVAAEVYKAIESGDRTAAMKALQLMSDYAHQIFESKTENIVGGSYRFSSQAVTDRMNEAIAQEQNKETMGDMSKKPTDEVIAFVQKQFTRFNEFLQQP